MADGHGNPDSEQARLWIAASELPKSPGHPFYVRLSAVLDANDFDRFVEDLCSGFYAPVIGRPSLAPGALLPAVADRLIRFGYRAWKKGIHYRFEGLRSA